MLKLSAEIAGDIAISDQPGSTMKKWRQIFELSQKDLAGAMEVSPSVISDYESGRRRSPGLDFLKKVVFGLITLDREKGGKIIARLESQEDAANRRGIIAMDEFTGMVPIVEFVESLDGEFLHEPERTKRRFLFGYTFLDSVEAILSFEPSDYVRIYGASSERALVFTRVSYGRSPMVFIRTYPIKPALVLFHQPGSVDPLALRLAEVENIHFARCDLEIDVFLARVRETRQWMREEIGPNRPGTT